MQSATCAFRWSSPYRPLTPHPQDSASGPFAIRYLADFTYERRNGAGWSYEVEDVKSNPTRTRAYVMKKKMMADKLGITITEV